MDPSVDNKMARELMSLISDYPYVSEIKKIKPVDVVMPHNFMIMSLSHDHWVDDSLCYDDHNDCNTDTMLAIFGQFSGEDPSDVCVDLIKAVTAEFDFFNKVGANYLYETGIDLQQWLCEMNDPNTYGDELALYALARRYNRHVIVYTSHKFWNTLQSATELDEWDTAKNCHLRLIYLGRFLFGTVKRKGTYASHTPTTPVPKSPRRGRPKKPKTDPHGYRKFEYQEDLSQPIDKGEKPRDLLAIPIDAEDRLVIAELSQRAIEIKHTCVNNAMQYVKELTDLDSHNTSRDSVTSPINEDAHQSMDRESTN